MTPLDKKAIGAYAVMGVRAEIARLTELLRHLEQVGADSPSVDEPAPKRTYRRKRRMTPEGRKRLSDALKARWAARKKAAK